MSQPAPEPEHEEQTPAPDETGAPETSDVPEPDAEPDAEPAGPQEPAQEPTEAPEPEPEQTTPEQTAQSEKQMERALRDLDKEALRHAERVRAIMADDFEALQPCPMCAPIAPGFRWPVMPDSAQLAAIKEAIGEPVTPDYSQDPHATTCETCGGYGLTFTGSRAAAQKTIQCHECAGKGWRATDSVREAQPTFAVATSPAPVGNGGGDTEPALPPEAVALKERGFIVVAPIEPPPPVPS